MVIRMAIPKKLTVFEIDPKGLNRDKVAVFTMKDGKVEAEYMGGSQYEKLLGGVLDVQNGSKTVTPEDGERFMELLPPAFAMSTLLHVEEGDGEL
jgi:hypothetical protein